MDLPTCPACSQSVLDDEATECPFCGAAMNGKSSDAVTGSAPAEKKPVTQAKTQKSRSKGDDDDPFGVASAVTGKSIPLLAKPVKGRLHRVVCPMCETAGFHSRQIAGRDVRCANKECLVPLFTAPPLEGEAVAEAPRAEAEDRQGSSIGLMVGIVIVAAAALAGGAWYATMPDASGEQEPFTLPPIDSNASTSGDNGASSTDGTGTDSKPSVAARVDGPGFEELWAESLERMVTDSRDQQNQRKAMSRQLTGEAFGLRGDQQAVDTQLKQLAIVAPRQKYLGISPLVALAWNRRANRDAPAAAAALERTLGMAGELPEFGADALDAATKLATILVVLDRAAEADTLLKQRFDNKALGQLMASLQRVRNTGSRNMDEAVRQRPVVRWAQPQRVSVTVALTCRGYSDKALAWATATSDRLALTQCVSAWGEAGILNGEPARTVLSQMEPPLADFSPARRAMVLSRLAMVLQSNGQQAVAATTLTAAETALKQIGAPAIRPFPGLRDIYELKMQDTTEQREAAIAAAEYAHALTYFDSDSVWENVQLALGYARSMGHSPVASQRAVDEREAGVTARLKVEFNLQTANEARSAYKTYRTNCNRLKAVADTHFALQKTILAAACDWGLADRVWEEIHVRTRPEGGGTPHEPWFDTALPSIIHTHYRATDATAKIEQLEAVVTPERLRENRHQRMTYQVRSDSLAAGESPEQAAILLDGFNPGRNEADSRWLAEQKIRLASRLVEIGKKVEALNYTARLTRDPVPRHVAFELVAGQITATGDRRTVPAYIKTSRLKPEDRVALRRGFVGALKPDPDPTAVTQTSAGDQ